MLLTRPDAFADAFLSALFVVAAAMVRPFSELPLGDTCFFPLAFLFLSQEVVFCPVCSTVHLSVWSIYPYTCTHVHMYTCKHDHMYTCTHVNMITCTHVHTYTRTHVHTYTCKHDHMYACLHVRMYVIPTVMG